MIPAIKGRGLDLALRALLVLGLIVLGWLAVSRGLAAAVREVQPNLALALAPNDSVALGIAADRWMMNGVVAANRAQALPLARRALDRDATNVSAIATFALEAEARGDFAREHRLFVYAARMSRRDLRTQIYFVESAVARGDVTEALRHYDIALRTSASAPEVMFPVLRGAISDPQLRHALARMLASNPPWGTAFLGNAANTGPDFVAVAALLTDMRTLGAKPQPEIVNAMLNQLVAAHPDVAWRYYVASHRGVDPVQPVNSGFDHGDVDGSPFDWQLTNDNGIETVIEHNEGRGVLSFSLPATAAGPLARQLRVLAPGTYHLETLALNLALPQGSRPFWQVICIDGRPLGTVEIGNAPANGARFGGAVTIPADCKAQWLQLVARPTDAVGGSQGMIDSVSLRREG